MRHQMVQCLVSRVNIETAAKLCTGSNLESYKWRPSEIADSSPPAGETESPQVPRIGKPHNGARGLSLRI